MKAKRLIEKSDGNGNIIVIPNPLYYEEDGNFVKYRRNKNTTPKKKRK